MTQMHPNQIPTSPHLVRELLRSQYPSLADEPIAENPFHGTDNDVYRVGKHHSVRLPIIDWSVANEEKIRSWLPWMRDRLSIKVPVPVHYGEPDCGYPHHWSIYPWFSGETLPLGTSEPRVARDVTAFLKEIRALPTNGAPESGRSPHAFDADVRQALAKFLPNEHPKELTAYWDAFMQTPEWDGSDALWMHGDVQAGNLIFENGRLVAAIDWSGLGVGDPVNDLQIAWNTFTPEMREIFRQEMDVNETTWNRARARAFIQACFQLPYYRDTFPTMANQARYVFRQILDEMNP